MVVLVQLGEKAFKPETTVRDIVSTITSSTPQSCHSMKLKMDPKETLSSSSFNVSIVWRNIHFQCLLWRLG